MSWLRAALVGTAAAALVTLGSNVATARVGITSATNGDPLGRPPGEVERVLTIGIDVQANEVVTTKANDRAHLLFLDGTSLTVGPDSVVTIDKFVFDPDSKQGELAFTATKGVFRLVGGKISKTTPIVVTTPSSTIGIRGGISIFTVTNARTVANFIFGKHLTMSSFGITQTATRAGTQISANAGSIPGPPTTVPTGSLTGTFGQFEGTSTSGSTGGTGTGTPGTGTPGTTGAGVTSGNISAGVDAGIGSLSNTNSNQNPSTVPTVTTTTGTPGGTTAPAGTPLNPTGGSSGPINPPVTTANPGVQSPASGGVTPASTTTPLPPPTPQTSQTLNGYTGGVIVATTSDSQVSSRLLNVPDRSGNPADFTLSTDAPSSRAQTTIIIRQFQPTGGLGVQPATFELGSLAKDGSSSFVDNATITMIESNDPARKSKVSSGTSNMALASAATVQSVLPSGVTYCECAFLSWGLWGGLVTYPTASGGFRQGQVDTVFAAYVAGTLTNVQLPTIGTATYTGHAFGFVVDGSAVRSAAGGFTQTWNFASQTGMATITNFDGANYSSNTTLQNGTVNFSGPLSGAGRTGQINGSFYVNGSNPTGGQAGNFSVSNSSGSYKAGGIFAGQVK
jgi:hypothetical protein